MTTELDGVRLQSNDDLLVIDPASTTQPPVNLYLFGGCDLPSLFALGPVAGARLGRRVVVFQPGFRLALCRPDILLQTLQVPPSRDARETIERMRLPRTYFAPELFEPTFDPGVRSLGKLHKDVVVLSGGASVLRVAYRHRESGFLVDPGQRWLRDANRISREDREWFAANFESIGRLSVDDLYELLPKVVAELRARCDAHVVVFNTLTVEPGSREHSYQLRRNPEAVRRLEFHLALAELAASGAFHLVDVDDALKRAGIREQVDFAHFPVHAYEPIALAAERVLRRIGVL